MKSASVFLAIAVPAVALSGWIYAPPGTRGFTLGLGALLLALAAIDLKSFRLPDLLNLAVLLLGAGMVAMTRPGLWLHHLIGAGAGYLALFGLELAYRYLRQRDGIGRGDAKLLGALGMWVAWPGLAPILLVASLSGLAAALVTSLLGRQRLSGETAIAFGPWIALGGWIVWLAGTRLMPVPLG